MAFKFSILVYLCALAACVAESLVHPLYETSINDTLHERKDSLWLVIFYAPWCKYCQKVIPEINKVASAVDGKLSIGKIDCTKEEAICNDHNIESYPTLKYYRDSQWEEYYGDRDTVSMIDFANHMSHPAIQPINRLDDVLNSKSPHDVSFVAFDPNATNDSDLMNVESNLLLSTFQQVASKYQAKASFFVLDPETQYDVVKELNHDYKLNHSFIIRIEQGVKSKIFLGNNTINSLQLFVENHYEATVPQVHEGNIREFGYRDKFMAIAVVDSKDSKKTKSYLSDLRNYASGAPSSIHKEFQFAWVDGTKWKSFLDIYSITVEDEPKLFLLEYPFDYFWISPYPTNSSESVHKFLTDMLDNKILANDLLPDKKDSKHPHDLAHEKLLELFIKFYPWSAIFLIWLMLMICLPPTTALHDKMMKIFIDPILNVCGLLDLEDKVDHTKDQNDCVDKTESKKEK